MTDPHDPSPTDALDALASAHLDGLSSEAEAARIAADPELTARVAAMATVRTTLRSADAPVDDARRDAAIAAALAAFDAADALLPGADAPTPIAAGRRAMSRRTMRLVTAAAVAALLALAVPLLGRLDHDQSEGDLATSATEESDLDPQQRDAALDDAAGGGASPGVAAPAETFAATAPRPVDLGTFDDVAALDDAVRPFLTQAGAPEAAASTTAADGADTASVACTESPSATRADPPVLIGSATVDERHVVVFVFEGPDGDHEIVVVDPDDCSVITTRTLDD